MLAATARTKRFLEATQVLLTFVSVCAVVEAMAIHTESNARPGYHAAPQHLTAVGDRRIGALARTERKRREAEQQSSRQRLEREQTRRTAAHGRVEERVPPRNAPASRV